MARVVALDASVLIGHLDRRDAQHERARELLSALVAENATLGASTLTLAEVMIGPARAGRLEEVGRLIGQLEVSPVEIDAGSASRLAELRAGSGCRMPDCCVLLAAELAGSRLIATFDDRLAEAGAGLGFDNVEP